MEAIIERGRMEVMGNSASGISLCILRISLYSSFFIASNTGVSREDIDIEQIDSGAYLYRKSVQELVLDVRELPLST